MPNVQIRNVPDNVHRRLKVEAAQTGQSLNEFLRAHLAEVASRMTLIELAERTRARGPVPGITGEDIVRAIHEGRERR